MTKKNDAKAEDESKEAANVLQNKLAEAMMGLFELVVSDRSGHFAKHPEKIPDEKSVPSIISSYSVTNSAISGTLNLVPGPWGLVAIIPELAAVIRNQLAMIYDIGMAYGKSNVLNKELLAGILLTATGSSAGSLLVMQGNKVLVKRVALRVFQKIIGVLGGKVSQAALKIAIGKWFPLLGTAAMVIWSNLLTRQIGKKAIEIFEKDIVLSEEVIDEMPLETESVSVSTATITRAATPSISSDLPKIHALVNLMKVDGAIKEEECEYVRTIIENSDLTESEKTGLTQEIDKGGKFVVDYSAFANSFDDAIGLLTDLVVLAKRDGTFHISEKMFVKKVGKLLGFSDNDIEETMATTG